MNSDSQVPIINDNPNLQRYYDTLECRIGYRILLGDTRHHALYKPNTRWPFPIKPSLLDMENFLAMKLDLAPFSRVLDCGCGVGNVGISLAKHHSLLVRGIDVVDRHLATATHRIAKSGLPKGMVTTSKMDYHHLETIETSSMDGAFFMETLVHATDPVAALAGVFRVLKPGGSIVVHHYELFFSDPWAQQDPAARAAAEAFRAAYSAQSQQSYTYIPTPRNFDLVADVSATPAAVAPGMLECWLKEVGFENLELHDLTERIQPLYYFFTVLAALPYLFVRLFGLEKHFPNAFYTIEALKYMGHGRYVVISAKKPVQLMDPLT